MTGKIVVITGAKGGLGESVTPAFLTAGATVVGLARSIAAGDFPPDRFTPMPVNLTDAEAARKAVDEVIGHFGRIDALVHLIGGFAAGGPVGETPIDTYSKMIGINFTTAVNMLSAVVPRMRAAGAGRIVAVGSRAAADPPPGLAAYSASKAALVSLLRTVAMENKGSGITANVVLPGTMDTPANRAAMPGADPSLWVKPERVASLILWLCSDDAAHVTGAAIPMYGREL
jgi:NAD(P)-dependent dehydrogenase (short-subunit alcohol dehydrogenase family)